MTRAVQGLIQIMDCVIRTSYLEQRFYVKWLYQKLEVTVN